MYFTRLINDEKRTCKAMEIVLASEGGFV